jgi:hypothetical protein
MNAIELFHQNGKTAGVFYCEKCRSVHANKQSAERCCMPFKCDMCGAPSARDWLLCEICRQRFMEEKEAERFRKSERVEQWGGPVFVEGLGSNEGFFGNLCELIEWIHENEDEGEALPTYAWTCDEIPIVNLDYGQIMEDATQEAPECFDLSELAGVTELKAALATFNELNQKLVGWEPNFKKAVLVKPEVTSQPR